MANAVEDKSLDFAERIVKLYCYLKDVKKEKIMSLQLLRSGTSIGANIAEALEAQSDSDFIAKLYISLKECSETRYWLKLLARTSFLSESEYNSIFKDSSELYALLTSIIKSKKSNSEKKKI